MKLPVLGQPLDSQNLFSFGQSCKQKAGASRFAIQKHRASAAHADAAPLPRAKEFEFSPQDLKQSMMSVNRRLVLCAVDSEVDDLFHFIPQRLSRIVDPANRSAKIISCLTPAALFQVSMGDLECERRLRCRARCR